MILEAYVRSVAIHFYPKIAFEMILVHVIHNLFTVDADPSEGFVLPS
jgi:hypothetical protein